jgi:plastocyanin
MRGVFAAGAGVLTALALSIGCGGGGGGGNGGGNPSGPSNPPAPSGATITIVGSAGAQAFNPNPAGMPSARSVTWRNDDNEVHRIVANDNSFDTGNIAPGATSSAVTLPANGVRYHCTLHPTMVGAVNDTAGTTPPCSGLYC